MRILKLAWLPERVVVHKEKNILLSLKISVNAQSPEPRRYRSSVLPQSDDQ